MHMVVVEKEVKRATFLYAKCLKRKRLNSI